MTCDVSVVTVRCLRVPDSQIISHRDDVMTSSSPLGTVTVKNPTQGIFQDLEHGVSTNPWACLPILFPFPPPPPFPSIAFPSLPFPSLRSMAPNIKILNRGSGGAL